MSDHILPDSRAREAKGSVRGPNGTLVKVFCANCGKPWGMVPEEHMTFAFVLCDPCSEVYGNDAHFYKEPDEVFWKRIEEAQMQDHGRLLTGDEMAVAIQDPSSGLGKLAKEWHSKVVKTQK